MATPTVTPSGEYARLQDPAYLNMLAAVLPLHDLGHLVLPTDLLQKPGRLTPDERMIMQMHTTAGSEVLVEVAAAGLNRADVMQRKGLYPAPPGCSPDVPGLEYAGTVLAVGEGVREDGCARGG